MLISSVLEVIGIGTVIPILSLILKTDLIEQYPIFAPLIKVLGNPDRKTLIVMSVLFLVTIYTIKATFLSFLAWKRANFVWGVQRELSRQLFSGYLWLPYSFYLKNNSAQLIHNAFSKTGVFAQSTLMPSTILLVESFTFVAIFVLLVISEPFGALLIVGIVGLVIVGFHKITRDHILRWGNLYQKHEGKLIQCIQQGSGAIKDIKLLGCEDYLLEQYEQHNIGRTKVGCNNLVITSLPVLLIELLTVLSITILVITMLRQGKSGDEILPILGLFAAGAFRLMPSVNRIIMAVQNIKFSLPVVDVLYEECDLIARNEEKYLYDQRKNINGFNQSITLKNLYLSYSDADIWSLNNINLSILYGTTVGFVGSSGAGKSTLINVILGLLAPNKGIVSVDGVDVQTDPRGWQSQIGYVPQSIYLIDDTLRRNIAFGLPDEDIDEGALKRAIHVAQLEQFLNELPQGVETMVGERGVRLSGGQCQRIGIARALYHDPKVMVLDEATNSLDMATEQEIMDVIYSLKGKKTIIIVAHRLNTVKQCDHLFLIDNGKIVKQGSPNDVLPVES